ncbi:MAG TPA: GntR family transcriptional regulator, partial [Puia sp.]|nr:GntR family transcriptional regulator [Puia sp.]
MEFRENPAIYIQIADYVCDQILLGKWKLGEKIMSIRELAVMMQVNPNTVQRGYELLQQREIISNRRGLGHFIDEKAPERILAFRREQFLENELPLFLRNMYLLRVDPN